MTLINEVTLPANCSLYGDREFAIVTIQPELKIFLSQHRTRGISRIDMNRYRAALVRGCPSLCVLLFIWFKRSAVLARLQIGIAIEVSELSKITDYPVAFSTARLLDHADNIDDGGS